MNYDLLECWQKFIRINLIQRNIDINKIRKYKLYYVNIGDSLGEVRGKVSGCRFM